MTIFAINLYVCATEIACGERASVAMARLALATWSSMTARFFMGR
jgi:hypothetical protein